MSQSNNNVTTKNITKNVSQRIDLHRNFNYMHNKKKNKNLLFYKGLIQI